MIKLNEYGIFGYTAFGNGVGTYYCKLRGFVSQKRERNPLSRS